MLFLLMTFFDIALDSFVEELFGRELGHLRDNLIELLFLFNVHLNDCNLNRVAVVFCSNITFLD